MQTLMVVHRYLGETLFIVAVTGALISLFAKAPGSGARRGALILGPGRVVAGLIDLQWLLGVISYFALPAASRPSLLHPLIMTLVVVGFHIYLRRLQKEEPANQWPVVGAYLWVAAGIALGMAAV